jgi:hypothetical protein
MNDCVAGAASAGVDAPQSTAAAPESMPTKPKRAGITLREYCEEALECEVVGVAEETGSGWLWVSMRSEKLFQKSRYSPLGGCIYTDQRSGRGI